MTKGKLFVISGPSGAGKGTICKEVLDAERNIRMSVSMTTRAPRKGEVDKIHLSLIHISGRCLMIRIVMYAVI